MKTALAPMEPRRDDHGVRPLLPSFTPPAVPTASATLRSQAVTTLQDTPQIVRIRGCLEHINQVMVGDVFFGRRSRQRHLSHSVWANEYKVSVHGRAAAVQQFGETEARSQSERPVVDVAGEVIREYGNLFPEAFDREAEGVDPPAVQCPQQLCSTERDASIGHGKLSRRGVARCSLRLGRFRLTDDGRFWIHAQRSVRWFVPGLAGTLAAGTAPRREGSPDLLMQLALGRVSSCPFSDASIATLKQDIVEGLATHGRVLKRSPSDRSDVPIDYQFLELL